MSEVPTAGPPGVPVSSSPAAPTSMRRVLVAGLVGTALETYDLYLYGTAAALVFGRLFFPGYDPAASTLLALSTFAVSFVARPLGAVVFGHFGDRVGRKKMLYLTYLIMGLSTFAVGLLPTFDAVGVLAPIGLVVLRFGQGFGFGGEYSGAVLMLTEHAPPGRRGFYAGLNNIGPAIGFIASSGLLLLLNAVLDERAFLSWGWRIPFLLSIVLVAVGLYLRTKVSESPLFEQARARPEVRARAPLARVLREHPGRLALATGANLSQFTTFYLFSVFSLTYGTQRLGMPRGTVLTAVIIAVLTNLVVIPYASALSDRVGRRRVMLLGFVLTAGWAFPFFALFDTARFGLVLVAFVGLMIGYSIAYGPIAAFMGELFETPVRFTGSAVAYNLAGILGAAFAPIVASSLITTFDSAAPVSVYLIAITAVSVLCVLLAPETRHLDLSREDHR